MTVKQNQQASTHSLHCCHMNLENAELYPSIVRMCLTELKRKYLPILDYMEEFAAA